MKRITRCKDCLYRGTEDKFEENQNKCPKCNSSNIESQGKVSKHKSVSRLNTYKRFQTLEEIQEKENEERDETLREIRKVRKNT